MPRLRHCLDCGAPETVTFVSGNLSCRACSVARAVEQANRSFDAAEGMAGMPGGDLVANIGRSTQQITAVHYAAAAAREQRKAHRKAVAKALRAG